MGWKYAQIFVCGRYPFWEANERALKNRYTQFWKLRNVTQIFPSFSWGHSVMWCFHTSSERAKIFDGLWERIYWRKVFGQAKRSNYCCMKQPRVFLLVFQRGISARQVCPPAPMSPPMKGCNMQVKCLDSEDRQCKETGLEINLDCLRKPSGSSCSNIG